MVKKLLNKREWVENENKNNPINSPRDMEGLLDLFGSVQKPMDNQREQANFYKDKNYFEVEIKDKFGGGSSEQGQQTFDRLTGEIANKHNEFNFFENQQQSRISNNSQPPTNSLEEQHKLALWKWENWKERDYRNNGETREGLEKWIKELEIRININEWEIKEVLIFQGYFAGRHYEERKELALVHQSAQLGRDSLGNLTVDDRRKICFKNGPNKYFSDEQWNRIEQTKTSQHSDQVLNLENEYDNLTREELITEIKRLKAELQRVNSSSNIGFQAISSQRLEQRLQKAESVLNSSFETPNNSPKPNSFLPIIGVVSLVSLFAGLVIWKRSKKR